MSLLLQFLAVGGGAAGAAYVFFQFLGSRWIENRFAQRLDELKHRQAKELQRLRVEIDSTLQGVIALQQREFELLPRAWHLLDEAYGAVSWLTSPMQEYQDLNRLNERQLDEFLEGTKFTASQRDEVRAAANKLQKYLDISFRYNAQHVQSRTNELHNFVARNGIFFPQALKEKFIDACQKLSSATIEKKVGYEAQDFRLQGKGWQTLKEDVEPLYNAIELEIRARLRSHSLTGDGPRDREER